MCILYGLKEQKRQIAQNQGCQLLYYLIFFVRIAIYEHFY